MAKPLYSRVPDLIAEISFDGEPGATYEETITDDAPVSWWKLDESSGLTATDTQGANNGTLTGTGITYSVTGAITGAPSKKAMTFDGSSGAMSAADSASLSQTGNMSLEVWINLPGLPPAT